MVHTITEQLSLEETSADSLGQPSCPKQGHLEKVAQHLAGRVFCTRMAAPELLWMTRSSVRPLSQINKCFKLEWNFCISVCTHFLLSFHGMPPS